MICNEMGIEFSASIDKYGNTCPVCKQRVKQFVEYVSKVPYEFKRFVPLNYTGRTVSWIHTTCLRNVIQAHYNDVYPQKSEKPEKIENEQVKDDIDLLLEPTATPTDNLEIAKFDARLTDAEKKIVTTSHMVNHVNGHVSVAQNRIMTLEKRIQELEESRPQITQIVLPNMEKVEIQGSVRKEVDTILKMINAGLNVMLVGPTGSGKTYLGGQIAKLMKKQFSCISCFENMEPADILGEKGIKNGDTVFELSHLIETLQSGGVGLLDEFDAGNANTNLCLNSLLANRFVYLDHRRIEIPEEAVIMFSANTYGRGPSREYCGRNQMDAATRDRFKLSTVWIDYDTELEKQLCPDSDLRSMLYYIREVIDEYKIRQVVSTRTVQNAYKLQLAGFDHKFIKAQLLQDWTPDEINKL